MSEELDFEAEISIFNVETLNITDVVAPNKEIIQIEPEEGDYNTIEIHSNPGEVEDNTIEIHSNISEVQNDASEIQSNCAELENTIQIESKNKDVESDINTIQFHAGESHCDAGGEIQSDTGEIQSETGEIQSDTGEIQSDTGEIQSDTGEIENGKNLEEGEIEDNAPIPNPEEAVCRFFKRGYCLYGSECRNLHVSNKVYNMFESVLSNRSNLNSLQLEDVHAPAVFHLTPTFSMPDIESPWERGIKKAKIIIEKSNFIKCNQEDIENDWNRCLEVAKQTIQLKTNMRRQSYEAVKPHFDPKYSNQGKFREKDTENKIFKSNRPKSPLFSYSKYKKESNCEKKTKTDVSQTPDHLKWVDPWQRSKSPRKRTKSFSLSPSPPMKRTRKGSISSSSSSSSCFKRIYGSPHQSKSPKRFRSTSRSSSVFPRSKKNSTFKKRSHSRGRSYSRSPRKSYSKSSRKSCCSGSSSRTSSVSSVDLRSQKKSNAKTLPTDKLVSKNEKHCIPAEKSKDIYRSSFTKRSRGASSPCHSDKSSSSDLSMSSLSYTSISSNGKGTLQTSYTKAKEERSRSKIDKVPQVKSRGAPLPEEGYQKSNAFKKLSKVSDQKRVLSPDRSKIDKVPQDKSRGAPLPAEGYQKSNAFKKLSKVPDQKKVLSPDRKKLLMYKDTSTKAKSAEIATSQASLNKPVSLVSKPKPATKIVTTQKPSKAAMELLKYYSFGRKNNSANILTPASQSKAVLSLPTEAAKSTSASKIPNCQTKASEEPPTKTVSNIQVKPQKPINSDVMLKIKEAGSKRLLLLQQLQAIEDAIARKKQPLQ